MSLFPSYCVNAPSLCILIALVFYFGRLAYCSSCSRDVWKICAWRMSEDYRMPVYTRATQGALCGNLEALLPVCQKWEDVLWAHLRVLVDIRVETEVRSQLGFNQEYAEMPEKYWQKE